MLYDVTLRAEIKKGSFLLFSSTVLSFCFPFIFSFLLVTVLSM